MRSVVVPGALLAVALTFVALPARAAVAPVAIPGERELLTLPNGLKVLLSRDTLVSTVDVAVWYDAGLRRESASQRGIAALCQRLAFAGGAGDPLTRIEATGGTGGTVLAGDYACYYQTVPDEALELALDIEARRMAPVTVTPARLEAARQAVRRERGQPAASTPIAIGSSMLYGTAFRDHPYGHPVLGEEPVLQKLTPAEVEAWHRAGYRPRGTLVTIVGRFDPVAARALVRKHFGAVRDRGGPTAAEPPAEPDPTGERRSARAVTAPVRTVLLGYRGPGLGDPELVPLLVLSQILSGPGGRMERGVMPEFPSAFLATGDFEVRRDASLLLCVLGVLTAADSARAEAALVGQIERFGRDPVETGELTRAKRQAEARILFEWQQLRGRSAALATHEIFAGDAGGAVKLVEGIRALTAAELQAAAQKWLSGRRRNVAWIHPGPPAARAGGAR